jgi:DnaJ like chaperone protein
MESLISQWNLQGDGIENVHKIFREAKDSDQSIFELAQIFAQAHADDGEARVGVYIQLWQMALVDDAGAEEKSVVLRSLPEVLGLGDEIFDEVVARLQAENENDNCQQTLEECFAILGCSPYASDAEVRRCYKEKMAQYHPDAISGKNLAPGFVEFANQQSARINAAYEFIKQARGMR